MRVSNVINRIIYLFYAVITTRFETSGWENIVCCCVKKCSFITYVNYGLPLLTLTMEARTNFSPTKYPFLNSSMM